MIEPSTIGIIILIAGMIIGAGGSMLGPFWKGDPYKWAPIRYMLAALMMGLAINAFVFAYIYMTITIPV